MSDNFYILYAFADRANNPAYKKLTGVHSNENYAKLQANRQREKGYDVCCEYRQLNEDEIKYLSIMSFLLCQNKSNFSNCGEKIFAGLTKYNKNTYKQCPPEPTD